MKKPKRFLKKDMERKKKYINELKRNYMKGIFLIVMHEAFWENEGKNDWIFTRIKSKRSKQSKNYK